MFDHFPLGICNPHPLYLYFILPPGALADSQSESLPSGVPADLQSAVKKCSTTSPRGFAIPILFICISFSRQALWLILNQKVSRQAFQRICNPLSKNVRPLSPGDLQSPSSLFVFHSKTIARTTVIPFSCVIVFLGKKSQSLILKENNVVFT